MRYEPEYIIVDDPRRQRRDGAMQGVGVGVGVVGAGLLLYLLLKNLGLGGTGDQREAGRGKGEEEGPGAETLPPTVPPSTKPPVGPTKPPAAPTRPKPRPMDEQRLTFVMTSPRGGTPPDLSPITFRLQGDGGLTYSLGGLIKRVREGGRADVTLKIRGDIREGSAAEALAYIRGTGIEVWD